jgi:epoxyqueuosine reductase QueG
MEHPVLTRIRRESFTPFGWFEPRPEDQVPAAAKFVILIGNAGPDMFRRFAREHQTGTAPMDDWTRVTVDALARELDATAVYPFDRPHLPFLTWARRSGAGHVSPLGLNIHPQFGLWHAYRAALLFPVAFDLPWQQAGNHPCETCREKPCLTACPVSAFDGQNYDVIACGKHLLSGAGDDCMVGGCRARLACPVGRAFTYQPPQMQFHMDAFQTARRKDCM